MPGATIQRPERHQRCTPPKHGPRKRVTSGKWEHVRTLSMPVVRWMSTSYSVIFVDSSPMPLAYLCRRACGRPPCSRPLDVMPTSSYGMPTLHARTATANRRSPLAPCHASYPSSADMRSNPSCPDWPVRARATCCTRAPRRPRTPTTRTSPQLARAHARPQTSLQHLPQRCPPRRP